MRQKKDGFIVCDEVKYGTNPNLLILPRTYRLRAGTK